MMIKAITILTLAAALVTEIAVRVSTSDSAPKKTPIVEVTEIETYLAPVEQEDEHAGIDCELIVTPSSVTRVNVGSSC